MSRHYSRSERLTMEGYTLLSVDPTIWQTYDDVVEEAA
jgi:hypothetical protein